jgi:type IV fimbrial biogenesis protein FimT
MRTGFTIIELMTTLVILGILIMVAIPSFNDLVVGTRIKGAASDIYAALTFARSEAIKRNTNVTVGPLTLGGQWVNGWQVMAGATVLATHGALSNLTVECPADAAARADALRQRRSQRARECHRRQQPRWGLHQWISAPWRDSR